jgi:hypothetical protein
MIPAEPEFMAEPAVESTCGLRPCRTRHSCVAPRRRPSSRLNAACAHPVHHIHHPDSTSDRTQSNEKEAGQTDAGSTGARTWPEGRRASTTWADGRHSSYRRVTAASGKRNDRTKPGKRKEPASCLTP